MIPRKIQERIQYVLDKFDFEKVLATLNSLDWKWIKPDFNGYEIPNVYRMKVVARTLMETAYKELIKDDEVKVYTAGTGGFVATCSKEDDRYDFVLQFVLTEYDSEYYDRQITN